MILREVSVERFSFTCAGCGHVWVGDYDVQHVRDGHGHDRDYFFRDGQPCSDPTGRGMTDCPRCGRDARTARLIARRASAAVTDTGSVHPGESPAPARTAERAQAPLLPGEQPPSPP